MTKPEIAAKNLIAAGRFLELSRLEFVDENNHVRHWECCNRVNSRGAAIIIAVIKPEDELLLIRQFRPPAGKFMIEFPAGLIDPDESAAETAVRELAEETGYRGRITAILPPANSSPGMSGETIIAVQMEIDGAAFRDRTPEPDPEDGEFIECFTVPLSGLSVFLDAARRRGDGIDAKLAFYALGLAAMR
jgi:8-oxo-dGTP pyrophosphatase MutT (NUDIX family)